MKKNKLIIVNIALSILLILSVSTNIYLLSKNNTDKKENTTIKENDNNTNIVGVYYTNNYQNKGIENSITLKEDSTCIYFNNDRVNCTYKASNKEVVITLISYQIQTLDGLTYSIGDYKELKECNNEIDKLHSIEDTPSKLKCTKHTYKHTLTITNKGALLDNKTLLTKLD